jgi:hypothetical protein
MAQENISTQLNDLLASRDFQPELLDREGRPTDAENADIFTFDYVSGGGKNYGTMVIILDADNEMQVFYGDNLGRSMEGDDKTEFFDFVQHLHKFANMRRWTYSPKNINQVKYTMQGLAAIKEGLFEGYYGTRRVSYSGEPTEARLVIQHNRALAETDARFRYVESLFIETADAERFRLQFKNLAGGRAMLEHVRQGGKPYDVRGSHITEMVSEIATLSRFNRASAGRVLEGVTAELVTEAQQYYRSLRENLKRMGGSRGYQAYFESWHPAETTLQEELVDSIKTMFVEQTLDSRIEAALPVLARLQQENRMKEADIFESWAEHLSEGTWSLPETPEQQQRLQDLMSRELIVGPDATNATEQLDDLVGDDILFDRLSDLATRDASANVWDDTDVQARLAELGIQLPADALADPAAEPAAQPVQQPPVTEGRVKELEMDIADSLMSDEEFETKYGESRGVMARELGLVQDRKTGKFYNPDQEFDRLKNSPEFGAQMRRMSQRESALSDLPRPNKRNQFRSLHKLRKQRGLGEQGVAEDSLEEIDRRGFLKGAGAAAVAGAAGYEIGKKEKTSNLQLPSNPQAYFLLGYVYNIAVKFMPETNAEMYKWANEMSKLHSQAKVEVASSNNNTLEIAYHKGTMAAKDTIDEIKGWNNYPIDPTGQAAGLTQKEAWEYARKFMYDKDVARHAEYKTRPYYDKLMTMVKQNESVNQGVAEGSEELHPDTLELIDEYIAKIEPDADRDELIQSVLNNHIHTSELEYALQGLAEASGCNHTMEGKMCPEHGLAECGMHESQVAESRAGDALLARIKSLALLR